MKPAGFWDWLGPIILMAMFIGYLFLSTPSEIFFCSADESCFREWVGALSGWAAAVAAGITIVSLRQQAEAARKQTDFQLGDAPPSLDAVQHAEDNRRVVIRIRNWNRRSMILRRIALIEPSELDATLYLFFNPEKHPDFARRFGNLNPTGSTAIAFDPAILIEGWVKRESEPSMLKFSIAVHITRNPQVYGWDTFPVELEYELVGETKARKLRTHIHTVSGASSLDTDVLHQ
ncbi:hypothetical protein HRR99_03190 [Agrobacterium vaccinii]|uniref:hypothetical protein n=1 Tax=Agrobacterium vaccinii TaxID=2735528 RepID=UPI001E33A9FB|nr:hypothetical protein [Agrobacterium vaccinii]UHS60594.1 hypothetical protein HRR99_03190 [Agrobacterium vaccinii]